MNVVWSDHFAPTRSPQSSKPSGGAKAGSEEGTCTVVVVIVTTAGLTASGAACG